MKISKPKSVLTGILLGCWFLWGCEKEVLVPDLEGNIVGYLYTLDEYGLLTVHDGVKVSTRGLDGSYTTYSDEDGRYELKNVPTGTYELVFSKDGFISDTMFSVRHLGGQPTILGYNDNQHIYRWTMLYQIPTTTIQNIYLENDSLTVEFSYSGSPGWSVPIMLYFSDQDGFEKNSAIIFSEQFILHGNVFRTPFPKDVLPFEPGQASYVRAAVLSDGHTSCATINDEGNYVDCETEKIFYPILGDESDQFSLVVPE